MKILVTGAAGFIGYHIVKKLLEDGHVVIGLDNINDYYDVQLKYGRLNETGISKDDILENNKTASKIYSNYTFIKLDLGERESLRFLFEEEKFDQVCHMAAQAGVRYSIENPYAYIDSNIVGYLNILECCRNFNIQHLVYASSSSVYGLNEKTPFREEDMTDTPVSLYAATKKANELMAHTYSSLYNIRTTGLRFFTVYGPWGRPDMAPMLFAKAISTEESIKVFNNGNLSRDFTYIDDIVEGVVKVIYKDHILTNPLASVYNIGCSSPVQLKEFISLIETNIGKIANKIMLPMQKGDVYHTFADTSKLEENYGYKPSTSLEKGISRFIEWYKNDNPIRK